MTLICGDGVGWEVAQAGKRLIDATCPLVARIQKTARQLQREGRLVIVIGAKQHVEVRGIVYSRASLTRRAGLQRP